MKKLFIYIFHYLEEDYIIDEEFINEFFYRIKTCNFIPEDGYGKKNSVPELNLNKALLNTNNSNNNANTNRNPKSNLNSNANNSSTTGNTFSNIFNKFQFYRKNTDKNDNNINNNTGVENSNTKYQFFRRK